MASLFGQPPTRGESVPLTGSRYKDGVRCHLNPMCEKVNTSACNPVKCGKARDTTSDDAFSVESQR